MAWEFFVYDTPDFRATPTGRFNPQYTTVTYKQGDGWALVETWMGPQWAYLTTNRIFLPRATGLFAYRGGTTMEAMINPQVVTVRDGTQEGRWLKIDTWLGPRWVNLDFSPPTQHLDVLLQRFGNNISVYYMNMETGFVYSYNAQRVYFGASLSKASYALYLFQRAERGEIDLTSTLTFTAADQNWGSGIIQGRYRLGTRFTIGELIRLNVSYSDNVATLMLRRHFGTAGYRRFVESLGGNPHRVRSRVMDSDLTAHEAGLFMQAIFQYIHSGGTYSETFRQHLLNNQFPFIVADYPVASKTGWTAPRAWHDMAIVEAPSPYILVVMSARTGWTARDYRDFADISVAFQQFNNTWFTVVE